VVLFVVDAIRGDDEDCATSTRVPSAAFRDAPRVFQVSAGRELCVAAAGSTEVLWHAHTAGVRPAMALK
jgi:hypothetical protein